MIYLDNSATTYPKPPQVIRAVQSAGKRRLPTVVEDGTKGI